MRFGWQYAKKQGWHIRKQADSTGDDSVAWYLADSDAFEIRLRQMIHFVSKGALNIDGLGKKIVEKLMEAKLVQEYADIFTLTREQIMQVEGFKDLSTDNLLNSIDAARTVSLERLIYGLGIRHVGEETARILAKYSKTIEKFCKLTYDELEAIDGVGDVIAESIIEWLENPDTRGSLENLMKYIHCSPIASSAESTMPQIFADMTFVLTGTLPTLSRTQAEDYIRARGGKVASSVSKATTYVLVGDTPGSKYKEAQKLGIQILDEEEFLKI